MKPIRLMSQAERKRLDAILKLMGEKTEEEKLREKRNPRQWKPPTQPPTSEIVCPACSTPGSGRFCTNCGASLETTPTQAALQAEEERERAKLDREFNELVSTQTNIIQAAITQHRGTLRTRRSQLIARDEYGRIDPTRWHSHRKYFLDVVVAEQLGEPIVPIIREQAEHWIEAELDAGSPDENQSQNVGTLGGIEYEHFCARILREAGWSVLITKASQDQGVDLIATYSTAKVVIQCKRYGGSVGNQAVQAVLAAKIFEDAHHAVVVSNAPFTKSARTLATKSGVLLLHHSDLSTLAEALQFED